ncbi:hypothetical protein B0H13DRAFT_94494 [Mycena leptocephala]|nr:hypothetical protein B0H13DRAFT_94494 [Mycena leptocephala]
MNTPFNDILHTNVVPSEIDSQLIRELLVGPRREVAEITHEIERIRALLEELTGKRERLNDFIEAHEALISPVRRLPEDVVAEIFTACLPSGRNAVMSGEEAPLLLCHVTRTWRHVALSMPRLWASLHIVAPGNLKLYQISEAVDIWLSRSGVLPLSISIVRSCTSKIPTDFSVLLETLVRYSSRWNRMRFSLVSFSSFKPLAVLSPADVPILESVVFDEVRDPIWGPPLLEWSFVAFLESNSLRSVTIRRAESLDHFPLPWNHLRHLSLAEEPASWLTAAQGVAILRRSPNLETCSLPFNDDDPTTDLPICRMEHLRELYVVDLWG